MMARLFSSVELVGVLLVVLWIALPGARGLDRGGVIVLAAIALGQALVLRRAPALPLAVLSGMLVFATAVLGGSRTSVAAR